MTLDEAIQEFEFDCKIRHLSPKTIDNYKKQLRYFERFLANELSITSVEDVRPSHIKSFLSKMDDAGRKPQYRFLSFSPCNFTCSEIISNHLTKRVSYSTDLRNLPIVLWAFLFILNL